VDHEVDRLLVRLLSDQRQALGNDLVGSYLFGSAVTGDFEPGISDVDTVVVLRTGPTRAHLAALEDLHRNIDTEMPDWQDRVEATYLSARALETVRTGVSSAARISPGEPFHRIEVDRDWLIDWYQMREVGVALFGPPPASVVPDISHAEYVEAVRRHTLDILTWPEWFDGFETLGSRAYAILTVSRGLWTWKTGSYLSKVDAARHASETLPQHAGLIRHAVDERRRSRPDPPRPPVVSLDRFVLDVRRILAPGRGDAPGCAS
jgi:hypothetical protein